jgi:methylated-DNA-[protein]-cysteine S-methyltransferase
MPTFIFNSSKLRVAVRWEKGKARKILLNPDTNLEGTPSPPPQVKRFFKDLKDYLKGNQVNFALPIDWGVLSGFAKKVSRELAKTRCGDVLSYAELARRVGNPEAARAVGRVMAKNPFPLVIPCHRVIGTDGSLTGFSAGLGLKASLLELEKKMVRCP